MAKSKQELARIAREWRAANPDKVEAYNSKRRGNHPQKTEAQLKASKDKARWVIGRYGTTPEEYKLVMGSADQCGLCGGHFVEDVKHHSLSKVYDHDHTTKKFRGVLHRACNAAIGLFLDDPEFLRAAAQYLDKHKETK